jgi:hypothetical protein
MGKEVEGKKILAAKSAHAVVDPEDTRCKREQGY